MISVLFGLSYAFLLSQPSTVVVKVCAPQGKGSRMKLIVDILKLEQIDSRHKRYFPGYFLSSIILNIWKVQANYILHYNKIRAECAGQVVGDSGGFPKNFICFAATFSALHLTSPNPDS